MLALSMILVAGAVLLYVLSPAQMLYSTHPWPVYALLCAGMAVAVRRGRRGGIAVLAVAAVLTATLFYMHSVRSGTDGGELTVAVGDRFPPVVLPTSTGASFSSADMLGRSAVLYLFYRGDWCPFCRTELSVMNEYYERIRAGGVELVAVSVDPPDVSERLRERLAVPFTFLSDTRGELLDALGIRHRGGHGDNDIAYPAQVLVDANGVVRWTFRANSYRHRAHPDDVLAAIAALETR